MLSRNDPASVPFSMIDMDPEVNQLDTVTGVSPTMGTSLGLGLGTVGLPDTDTMTVKVCLRICTGCRRGSRIQKGGGGVVQEFRLENRS